ncbi:hypothetical protein NKJ06_21125 [Mesorhizobium sp. M0293]|uniref:hypothetical protein n=1 Tax=Mesorhizobium sp. M0293 TaxID=2956930 RepID=UPI003338A6BF
MPAMTISLDGGEGSFPDLKRHQRIVHIGDGGQPIRVAVLDRGMASGRPSVAIRIDLHDGTVVIAETSARLFASAGRMITAKYPDLFEGD